MSKLIASAAIRGAQRITREAEEMLEKALAEKGGSFSFEFPDTAYYLPMIYAMTGFPVKTISDMRVALGMIKEMLHPDPEEQMWTPYLGEALDSGMATLRSEEIIMAIRCIYGLEPAVDPETGYTYNGFVTDTIQRNLGIQLVDGTMPGFAAIIGAAPDDDTAVRIIRAINPDSDEAKQAQALLRSGQLLPKPIRPKGGTGPIAMAQVKQLDQPKKQADSGLDPIAEARHKALTRLAEILFDYTTDDVETVQKRRGLQALVRGTGHLSMQSSEQTKVVLHLGQAIDAQTKGNENQAGEELEHALEAGFNHPALYFDLGLLCARGNRLESALRNLQFAVKHHDFNLADRLLMGQVNQKPGRLKAASVEYLEALRLADSMVVPPEQSRGCRVPR